MEWTPRTRLAAALVALLALAALTVLSVRSLDPPAPRDAQAPPGEFSAARAYQHVERVGAKVHPAGSDAAADVRDYIASTLRGLGVVTEIQDTVGALDALGGFQMAHVRNVVGLLPGQSSTGRVIMIAHYDSVQVSYGANDDGAGVATLLETARALAAGPKPRNDIVFVFTDAEEACLCGAAAFVDQHRYAVDGGVALNFESRGSTGPVITFETSNGNSDVIAVYARAVPHPVATSFAVEVYRALPNDTDFSPFLAAHGFTGLNAAYIDGSAIYHTSEDRPSYMDKASLQNHGDNALALANAFGAADLGPLTRPSAFDATYFPVLGLLVRYPGWLVWPLAGLALLAGLGLAYLARRRDLTTWPRVAGGFGLAVVPILLAPVLAEVMWLLVTLIRPEYAAMDDPWRPGWFRIGVVALVATVLLCWYGLLRPRFGAATLAIGGVLWLAVFGVVFAGLAPGGSYLVALPALAASLAGAVALLVSSRWLRLLALTAGAAAAVLILAPTVQLFFPALGLATAGASAFFAILLGVALLPVVEYAFPPPPAIPVQAPPSIVEASPAEVSTMETSSVERRGPVVVTGHRPWAATPGVLAALLTVVFVALGLAVDQFDAAHPTRTQLMYALDTDNGQARWLSTESVPGTWTRQYVSGVENLAGLFPLVARPEHPELRVGPAEPASLPAPALTVDSDATAGAQRSVVFTITPKRAVRLVSFGVHSDATVVKAIVANREVPAESVASLVFHAPPAEGVQVRLILDGPAPLTVRVMDGSDGLTDLPGFHPRPAGVGVEGSHDSELVIVAKTYTL